MRFLICGAVLSTALLGAVVYAVPASAGGLSGLHQQVVVGDKVCMKDHYHRGDSGARSSPAAAFEAATRSWSSFTALEYGHEWGHYQLSADQQTSCKPVSTLHGAAFTCSIKALPCRPATPADHASGNGRFARHAPAASPAWHAPMPRIDLGFGHSGSDGDRRHMVWPGDAPAAAHHPHYR